MSAFLGPIHYWLFRKIKFQDELVKCVETYVKTLEQGEEWISQMNQKYGVVETGELAEIIDGGNIHGWLQERIGIVENRLAFLITRVTENHPERMLDINDVVYEFGKLHSAEQGLSVREAFEYLDNLLLNGMPCDRVNHITDEEESRIAWEQMVDIHASYWQAIDGKVEHYYTIRENLVVGILESSGIAYQQTGEQSFQLSKEV